MKILRAAPSDFPVVCELHRTAFSESQFGYNGEAELVYALQTSGDAQCSLVAEHHGQIVGHIMFSRMSVEADGRPIRAASLAPLSVAPEAQRLGVGTALTKAGLAQLLTDGFQISFVLGDAGYYSRFGYSPELAAVYQSPFAGPHFMAVHLDSSLKVPQKGKADYAPAFRAIG